MPHQVVEHVRRSGAVLELAKRPDNGRPVMAAHAPLAARFKFHHSIGQTDVAFSDSPKQCIDQRSITPYVVKQLQSTHF